MSTLPTPAADNHVAAAPIPSVLRRLACFVYEGVLLFGVVMVAGYLYSALTQQRHALQGKLGLQLFLFVVLAIYFTWFWSRGGQTVAMRAWRIRLVDHAGQPVSQQRALARYVLAWLWFAPALLTAWLSGLHSSAAIFGLLALGVCGYALLARWLPGRQFCHDLICGTQLVDWQRAPRAGR